MLSDSHGLNKYDFFFFVAVILTAGLGFFLILAPKPELPVGKQVIELLSPENVVVASKTCELQEECEIEKFSDALFGSCGLNWTFRIKAAEAKAEILVAPEQYWGALVARKGIVFSACEGVEAVSDGNVMRVCGDVSQFVNQSTMVQGVQNGTSLVIEEKVFLCADGAWMNET